MSFPLLSVVLDIVMAGLLVAVILFGLRLNRQLTALRRSREELKGLLDEFARSTDRAESALEALKRGARENVGAVKAEVDKAESLKDDLAFLTKRGEEIADRLESGVSAGRKMTSDGAGRGGVPGEARGAGTAAEEAPDAGDGESGRGGGGAGRGRGAKSKSDLLKALQGMR